MGYFLDTNWSQGLKIARTISLLLLTTRRAPQDTVRKGKQRAEGESDRADKNSKKPDENNKEAPGYSERGNPRV